MKTKLLLLLLLGWVGVVWGQEKDVKEDGNYYFKYISLTELSSLKNNSTLDKSVTINEVKQEISGTKYRVTVNKIVNDKVYFTFWKFNSDVNKLINNAEKNDEDSRVEYVMSLEDFKNNTKPIYNIIDWRAGFFTTPFKLRFNDFTFDANVNLGINIGAKFRFNREKEDGFSIEPILGFGLASIKIDDTNSNALSATNLSAFSLNTGLLFHITREINLGVTYGWDNLIGSDNSKYDWKYNGNGWLGLGINISFSNDSNNTGSTGDN